MARPIRAAAVIGLFGIVGCGDTSPPVAATGPASRPLVQQHLAASRPATHATTVALAEPFLLHLPGIGGRRAIDVNMTRGLVLGGFAGQIRIYDWTEHDEGLTSLWGVERHRRQAKLIAEQLTAAYDKAPDVSIYFTAHSGGTGLAVWALEMAPPRVKVKDLLLLEPALSPTYDLTKALRHVTDKLYVFSSTSDPVVGLGCQMMGTIDGPRTAAAGSVGFTRPPGGDPVEYAKLISLPYNPAWAKWYNYGDHVGPMSRSFGVNVLAPLLFRGVLPAATTTRPVP